MRILPSALGLLVAATALSACGDDTGYHQTQTYQTQLVQYQSCYELEQDLKSMLIAEVDTHFDQAGMWPAWEDGTTADPSAGQTGDTGGTREEGKDYSGTNNQEDGVDEADFVKTDGYNVYVLNGNRLHIFGVPEFGDLEPLSVTRVEGVARQMLINRDAGKAVVFSHISPESLPQEHPLRARVGRLTDSGWMWRVGLLSKITVLDISDRAAPELVRELYLEGQYQTARMIDESVRVGAYSWLYVPGLYDWWWYYHDDDASIEAAKRRAKAQVRSTALADLLPLIYERTPDGELTTHSLSQSSCRSYYRPSNSTAHGITSLVSMDLLGDVLAYDSDHVVSNWPTLYASTDYLYIAEPANDWWWFWWNDDAAEQLNLHAFDISRPGQTSYLGSGRVEGLLHNQFSLDEEDGFLRVATTTNFWNRWWLEEPPASENHLYVMDLLGRGLETVGHVGGIAEGERIFAARMIGDRGYMVTFRNIDPLFTFDLSNPYRPRLVGELEIPGFSSYIHPIADDKLLTIGVGGDENGANWRTQISLFDVSDFAAPALSDVQALVADGEWGWSEAQHEHKAFQYWAPAGLLAVPLSSYDYRGDSYWYQSKLELISVDSALGALASYGSIDHSHFFNAEPERWYDFRDVRRSIFMGDYIYAISDRGVTVHTTNNLGIVTQQPLPGYSPGDWYWWW